VGVAPIPAPTFFLQQNFSILVWLLTAFLPSIRCWNLLYFSIDLGPALFLIDPSDESAVAGLDHSDLLKSW
jgi:hypothetical protein